MVGMNHSRTRNHAFIVQAIAVAAARAFSTVASPTSATGPASVSQDTEEQVQAKHCMQIFCYFLVTRECVSVMPEATCLSYSPGHKSERREFPTTPLCSHIK